MKRVKERLKGILMAALIAGLTVNSVPGLAYGAEACS